MSRILCIAYVLSSILITTIIRDANCGSYKLYETISTHRNQELPLRERMGYDVRSRFQCNGTKILISPYLEETFKDTLDRTARTDHQLNTEHEYTRRSADAETNFFDFDRFPRYEEIINFTQILIKKSKHAEIINIGRSFEGRPIIGLKIEGSKENPRIFIDAGIHAREWAAPITALYLMKKAVDHEDTLHQKISIYIVPTVNPDGYEFSHTVDRYWRKTRSRIRGTDCIGVDANRNFDSHWAEFGADLNPCSSTFPGLAAFTETESRAVRDAILTIKPHLYLTLHSYGPMLLYPWGFTKSLPDNWQELDKLAKIAAHKLKQVNRQNYTVGSSTNVLYKASGGSDDWAMQVAKVPLVYTMELPDYGEGFIMPVEKIKPMVRETYEAFKVFARYVCALRHINCK